MVYPIASSFTLSKADFALFYLYKTQFYNALLVNFPSLSASFQQEVAVMKSQIYSSNGPNLIQYLQTSTASPVSLVYNITYDRGAHTATCAARNSAITISFQEYLMCYPIITLYANQVALA